MSSEHGARVQIKASEVGKVDSFLIDGFEIAGKVLAKDFHIDMVSMADDGRAPFMFQLHLTIPVRELDLDLPVDLLAKFGELPRH